MSSRHEADAPLIDCRCHVEPPPPGWMTSPSPAAVGPFQALARAAPAPLAPLPLTAVSFQGALSQARLAARHLLASGPAERTCPQQGSHPQHPLSPIFLILTARYLLPLQAQPRVAT